MSTGRSAEGDRARSARGLAVVAVVAVALMVTGVVLAVAPHHHGAAAPAAAPAAAGPGPASSTATPSPTAVVDDRGARDAVASRPMPSYPLASATPQPVTTRDPGEPIALPSCGVIGPAGVPTGCPHTREGAMAQLAAIDQTALQSGTLAGARAVIAAWALPGGPTTTSWSVIAAMASIINDVQLTAGARLPLTVTPMMGLFKGQVGDDYVVPCVDFEFALVLGRAARVAAADCQRMVWTGGRWLIGAGSEPAGSPNAWPDTDAAIAAGYRDLSWQR